MRKWQRVRGDSREEAPRSDRLARSRAVPTNPPFLYRRTPRGLTSVHERPPYPPHQQLRAALCTHNGQRGFRRTRFVHDGRVTTSGELQHLSPARVRCEELCDVVGLTSIRKVSLGYGWRRIGLCARFSSVSRPLEHGGRKTACDKNAENCV